VAVEPAETTIVVHRVQPVEWAPPDLTFRATVSAGTYLRAIARDLGNRLGVGAHLTALRREAIGEHRVEDAVMLEDIGPEALQPVVRVLRHLPAVELDPEARTAVLHGRRVADRAAAGLQGEPVLLLEGSEVIAVAQAGDGWLKPSVVLAEP
jgi:tRNA pseudouridine55 synthase